MRTEPTNLAVADAAEGMIAIHLRNLEAFAKAQQALLEGSKALVGQQLDTFKSMLEQAMKASHEIMTEPDVKANLRLRFDTVKASMQDGIGNANIISEMSARSNAQAAQIIQSRTFEALDEWEATLEKMLGPKPAPSGRQQ